jgi:hypothetical protein
MAYLSHSCNCNDQRPCKDSRIRGGTTNGGGVGEQRSMGGRSRQASPLLLEGFGAGTEKWGGCAGAGDVLSHNNKLVFREEVAHGTYKYACVRHMVAQVYV